VRARGGVAADRVGLPARLCVTGDVGGTRCTCLGGGALVETRRGTGGEGATPLE